MTKYTDVNIFDFAKGTQLSVSDQEKLDLEEYFKRPDVQKRLTKDFIVRAEQEYASDRSPFANPATDDQRMTAEEVTALGYKPPSNYDLNTTNLGGGHKQADCKRMTPEEIAKARITVPEIEDKDMQWTSLVSSSKGKGRDGR